MIRSIRILGLAFLMIGLSTAASAQIANGQYCSENFECISGYCADGRICAPRDGTGRGGEYCHHNNHCASGTCICPDGYQGDFCKVATKQGYCAGRDGEGQGGRCRADSDCAPGLRCADGRRCAWPDGTAKAGQYCHHDNHCASKNCKCPADKSWGFCAGWERFNDAWIRSSVSTGDSFVCY